MKNILIRIICLSLATLHLSACSNRNESVRTSVNEETPITTATTSITETAAPTEATTQTPPQSTTQIATEPETESVHERNPDDFYKNFKPLAENVFLGNEVVCEPEVYAEQIKLIDEEIEYIYGEDYAPSTEAKLLMSALLSNQNIDYKYKKWLFHMIEYFNDNTFLPKQEIYEKLLNLQIETQTFGENDEGFFYGAATDSYMNKIEFYILVTDEQTEGYYSSPEYEETGLSYVDYNVFDMIKHEILHIAVSSKIDNIFSFFNEGMTVLLEKEYNNGDIYSCQDQRVTYLKMLIEVIGKDKVLEAYSFSDNSIIEAELLKIIPDETKIQRLYELISEWENKWEESNCDFDAVIETTVEIRAEMSQILTEYYNTLHPDADESSLYSIYNSIFTERTDASSYDMTKAYFNSRYDEDFLVKRLY